MEKQKISDLNAQTKREPIAPETRAVPLPDSALGKRFLRIPPFPGAKTQYFERLEPDAVEMGSLLASLRRSRVGGTYWAAQPDLPGKYVLIRSRVALEFATKLSKGDPVVVWEADSVPSHDLSRFTVVTGECDPWHMMSGATAAIVDTDDEIRVIAALLDVPVWLQTARGTIEPESLRVDDLVAQALPGGAFANPFTNEPMTTQETIELCGFWRKLIDSNRDIAGGVGFAFWKQDHVAPLLWNGSDPFRFLRNATEVESGATLAIWRAKAAPQILAKVESCGAPLIEVEDGFLRSRGLGADCIPPLSITVDRMGAHFDPSRPSELELLLEVGGFDESLLGRARELRGLIVSAGLGKYEQGGAVLARPDGERPYFLVPGQVEDDRAVQAGGCGLTSNLELLRRVRERAPEAHILYKPHPDVLAGHRRGAVPDRVCLQFADEIVGEVPIGSLIGMVDEVHVNTSLAGFEALLRGKAVTTYGVPFYAGWGLTRDLGPVPARRAARRTIDELVAATLLVYPRYLDPVTGLPCPAEIVVSRLSDGIESDPGLLVGMRRLQGKVMRRLRSLVQ